MLNLENIRVTYGKGTQLQRDILQNLNLCVNEGELVIIVGGNGAGKSTVLNVISGLLMPDSGSVWLEQRNITSTLGRKRSALIAKVLQDPKLGTMEHMTILENMAFAAQRGQRRSLFPFVRANMYKKFQSQLAELGMGLENRMDDLVANLSGGQRQALSLIMALASDSKILLLDEITAALDPNAAEKIMQIAAKIVRQDQKTTIMITHNMEHAIKYADRILLLSNGRFVKEFSGEETKKLTPSMLSAYLYQAQN